MLPDYLTNATAIGIFGFGREGQATYSFLRQENKGLLLTIADEQSIDRLDVPADIRSVIDRDSHVRTAFGPESAAALAACDTLVKSPGIPPSSPVCINAIQRGARITSHTEIFFDIYPRNRIIGVTGTKGKSTTATLISDMLQAAGFDSLLAGNIGVPPLGTERLKTSPFVVYELSSFQLTQLGRSPHIAVLLNIVPEHLNYHGALDNYVAAKENICRFQVETDYLVYNADSPIPSILASRSKSQSLGISIEGRKSRCFLRGTDIIFGRNGDSEPVLDTRIVPLAGRFNLYNVMAATAVARLMNVPRAAIETAVRKFKPLPHRLTPIGEFHQVRYYDDSIATIPEATMAALSALGPDVYTLVAGGFDRGLDFRQLGMTLAASSVRVLILFPLTGKKIWNSVRTAAEEQNAGVPEVFFVDNMSDAAKIARARTPAGKICLLSPASPSFGLFRDYQERGDAFARAVAATETR
jgi:UDP-N-acetylmuramoylalanine--D-glutamate ligase